ncbi:hypothetical protein A9977_32550 [Variovorax sp. UMC13]|nr:hypothetical protein [Variovorax sp. UMC13]
MAPIMDTLLALLARLFATVAFGFVFYWPGWAILKLVTWGRYPRRLRSAEGLDDAHGISAIGFASCGLLVAIAWKLVASFH